MREAFNQYTLSIIQKIKNGPCNVNHCSMEGRENCSMHYKKLIAHRTVFPFYHMLGSYLLGLVWVKINVGLAIATTFTKCKFCTISCREKHSAENSKGIRLQNWHFVQLPLDFAHKFTSPIWAIDQGKRSIFPGLLSHTDAHYQRKTFW